MFFILTTGRSGSKSIAEYLSSSPELICLHEPEPVLIEEATQYIYGNYSHDQMVELLRSTRPLRIDGREYGESNQKLSFVIPAILEAFPDSKFIWLVRDGRDVVNSTFSFGWYDLSIMPDSHWQSHLIQGPKVGDIDEYQWDKMDTFGKCCWYWSFTNKCIKKELSLIDQSRWKLIKLEDINYQDIFNLLGIKTIDKKILWINKKRKYVPNKGWQNWNEGQRNTFRSICGKQMNEMYPGWITEDGKWVELTRLTVTSKVKHYIQNMLVNVSGKQSFIYRAVELIVSLVFRDNSSIIMRRLDKIYRRLSGEE